MIGVFSNYLKKYWNVPIPNDGSILTATIEHMQAVYKKDEFHKIYSIEKNHHILVDSELTKNEYFVTNDYIKECITNIDLQKIIIWINKNILLEIINDSFITTLVKLRIATSMLNKLVDENKLDKSFGIIAHKILVENVRELRNNILDEELPFLR